MLTTLVSFSETDGANPQAELALGAGGNFGAGYVGGEDAGPGVKTVEVRDLFDVTAASRFLRIQVTR